MQVYSYHFGANPRTGIGVQAQSPELASSAIGAVLTELASFHALESSDHTGEMLSFFLTQDRYRILGTSYLESPKDSGYNRSAPCSLQYVASEAHMAELAPQMGRIVNFFAPRKPASAAPAALPGFPLNESGFSYHHKPGVLAALTDAFLKVCFAKDQQLLLVALPRSKSSEHATARYTVSQVLNHLPASLRPSIRFFTGLPVTENVADPLAGFDNAVQLGANVLFCSPEHFELLRSHRTCLALNMEAPPTAVGSFADYVAHAAETSATLATVCSAVEGVLSYEALNEAARQVKSGNVDTLASLQQKLVDAHAASEDYHRQLNDMRRKAAGLQHQCNELHEQNQALVADYSSLKQENVRLEDTCKQQSKELKRCQAELAKANQQPKGQQANQQPRSQQPRQPAPAQEQAYLPPFQQPQQSHQRVFASGADFDVQAKDKPASPDKKLIICFACLVPVIIALTALVTTLFLGPKQPQQPAAPAAAVVTAVPPAAPSDEPAAEPTAMPAGEPVDEPTAMPAEELPTPTPGLPEPPAGAPLDENNGRRPATVNAGQVRLRKAPDTGSDILDTLNKNTPVVVLEEVLSFSDELWYMVDHEGVVGYIRADLVTLFNPDGE